MSSTMFVWQGLQHICDRCLVGLDSLHCRVGGRMIKSWGRLICMWLSQNCPSIHYDTHPERGQTSDQP